MTIASGFTTRLASKDVSKLAWLFPSGSEVDGCLHSQAKEGIDSHAGFGCPVLGRCTGFASLWPKTEAMTRSASSRRRGRRRGMVAGLPSVVTSFVDIPVVAQGRAAVKGREVPYEALKPSYRVCGF